MTMKVLAIFCLTAALSPAFFSQAAAVDTTVLRNEHGVELHVIQTGAIVQKLIVPDAEGRMGDIVAGFNDLAHYDNNTYSPYFGAVIGRVANRIGDATFVLDGKRYHIPANDHQNALHGGKSGWSVKTWNMTEVDSDEGQAVLLTYISPNGDEGFPGEVHATVKYTLTESNEVLIDFEATSDAPTPINMAQHSYFNLDVPGTNKTILDHDVFINGSYVTPVNELLIPTGGFEAVDGTPYSFEVVDSIGSRLFEIDSDPVGYDVNYVLPELAATVSSPASGRVMDLLTQAPGMQFYTGNQLNGSVIGKNYQAYPQYGMFVMETQDFPNFVNEPSFPACVLRPGGVYKYRTVWQFSTLAAASPPAQPAVSVSSIGN
ncbi:hypothetical protein WJX73_000061 [Symbiochloris irregularis]|uniref:Aldose 1-epimerase n=1 Tax=Symbiochloris irregularis TaxID=706552 RepID=A0AAW1NNW7_9CHLO